jgi:hypothetical protein
MLDTLVFVFVAAVACIMMACIVFVVLGWMFEPIVVSVFGYIENKRTESLDAYLKSLDERWDDEGKRAKTFDLRWRAKRLAEKRRQREFAHDCAMSGYSGLGHLGREDS